MKNYPSLEAREWINQGMKEIEERALNQLMQDNFDHEEYYERKYGRAKK